MLKFSISFVELDLSMIVNQICFRYILTGIQPQPLNSLDFLKDRPFYEVISGNLFDGDKSYNMVGFLNDVVVKDFV